MSSRRARIIGVGVLSGAGRGATSFWRSLLAAEPGQARHDLGDPQLAAMYVAVPDERAAARDDLASHWLSLAGADALREAQPALARSGSLTRLGLIAGSSLGGMSLLERLQRHEWDPAGARGPGLPVPELPFWRGLYDGPSAHVGAAIGARAGAWTLNTACSSGANALGLARRWLERGRLDVAVVAGFDVVSPFVYAGFAALGAVDPLPCSPFGAERQGLNLGEAAVALVLVRAADAPTEDSYVDVVGYGSSCDAHHLTRPDPTGAGLARAIEAALADAGLRPADVALVSAHATGTPQNDAMEAAAFARVFGSEMPLVHAAKPVTGHTLGAAGTVDALAMILALRHGGVPRTYRRGEADPALGLSATQAETPLDKGAVVLSTSSGFGGSNAALLFMRAPV
jgi:3-oxoacyl-[acyl-carrier-protein] synthase II